MNWRSLITGCALVVFLPTIVGAELPFVVPDGVRRMIVERHLQQLPAEVARVQAESRAVVKAPATRVTPSLADESPVALTRALRLNVLRGSTVSKLASVPVATAPPSGGTVTGVILTAIQPPLNTVVLPPPPPVAIIGR
jgi:hypothetical protein